MLNQIPASKKWLSLGFLLDIHDCEIQYSHFISSIVLTKLEILDDVWHNLPSKTSKTIFSNSQFTTGLYRTGEDYVLWDNIW